MRTGESQSTLMVDAQPLLQALRQMKRGDFSVRLPLDRIGLDNDIAEAFNDVVELNERLVKELQRISNVVGREGRINQRASLGDAPHGSWAQATEAVNTLVSDLVRPTTEVARVIGAVAKGDLNQTMPLEINGAPLKGEFMRTARTINTMVDQLSSFASEVTRVAQEVGTEGKLGGQAQVKGVSGTWKDLTVSVNSMADNLTAQVRNIAEVTTAVANGDLSKKITVDVRGEMSELKNTINTMVDQLKSFAAEVTRVAREVGTEGKLGGQADVKGVSGTWRDLTDSVNSMASNLTAQVRNIAEVTTAVANGHLSKKITVDVKGELLELKVTINTMVDQLSSFAAEVTRVAREVGTEGILGGQADVKGVSGTWRDLTDSVNSMASNLTSQVRNIADVTTAVANGDLSKTITVDVKGEILELKNTINTMVDQLGSFASEVTRVAREVGTEGKLGGQATVKGVSGTWKDLTDNVNSMASNLTSQVRNIAEVTTAVANGNLSKKITVDVQGEILELKNTINTMVDQLSSFASEVTRVARDVGTEGKLGGQAQVSDVAGIWKDLTDNVNSMASNLTLQVREIAKIVTAVANGDLKRKLVLQARGEIAALADTINEMIDTLDTFADQVSGVAREVGVEGKLGGQARVPGAAGTWRDLTDNVNQLAANLTNQMRAIADVATAVTKGDLTRSISVEASGELANLKDNINEMIRNLKDTTQKNTEQDWLKTNLTKFTRMLQGQRDMLTVANLILKELTPLVSAHHGAFYVLTQEDEENVLKLLGSYAYTRRKHLSDKFAFGEGLVGQCALERQRILLYDVPDDYIKISSGLGESTPRNIVVLPVLFEGNVKAVIELASIQEFNDVHIDLLDQLTESIGIVLNTIQANTRTENLLKQSQSLAQELQSQQQELQETNRRLEQQAKTLQASELLLTQQQEKLQQTNQELGEKAELLVIQKQEVEKKNSEIENNRRSLEEKARQLSLTSKYKSEFLANMSHELRTPLNSLLILSQLLSENTEGNLTEMQVGFSKTIHDSGSELLALINDILDLSKIESGTMVLDLRDVILTNLLDDLERSFRQIANHKGIDFEVELGSMAPPAVYTDAKRLNQVLKNLLSNAFKFTAEGKVSLKVEKATSGWNQENTTLNRAREVIAFAVTDTGIGIAEEKQRLIFEAFHQADGTTSRKYGGTGLGLAISRELTTLLGGQIVVESKPDSGSTFTLYLPVSYIANAATSTQQPTSDTLAKLDSPLIANTTPMLSGQSFEPRLQTMAMLPLEEMAPPLDPPRTVSIREEIKDDRDELEPGKPLFLIIEEDPEFARELQSLARNNGYQTLVSQQPELGLMLAQKHNPTAIALDLKIADGAGWTIVNRLKRDPKTRSVPVHMFSLDRTKRVRAYQPFDYIESNITSEKMSNALEKLGERAGRTIRNIVAVGKTGDTQTLDIMLPEHQIRYCDSAQQCLQLLNSSKSDCVLIDLDWMEGDGVALLREVLKSYSPAVLLYSEQPISNEIRNQLKLIVHDIELSLAKTPDQLLCDAENFFQRLTKLTEKKESNGKVEHLETVPSSDNGDGDNGDDDDDGPFVA